MHKLEASKYIVSRIVKFRNVLVKLDTDRCLVTTALFVHALGSW